MLLGTAAYIKWTRDLPGMNINAFRNTASGNGQRFLINSTLQETASAPITLVLNWTAGVKR